MLGVKINASTHTAVSSTTTFGRKSATDENLHDNEQSKEEYSPDVSLNDNVLIKPKSLEEEGGLLLRLIEGRSNKSNSDKHTKQA